MGKSALTVLALADPVRDCLDGREPFCVLAGRVVRRGFSVCWNRLLSPNKETHRASRARLSAGGIDWKRHEGEGVAFYLPRRSSPIVFAAMDGLRLLRHGRHYVALA